MRRWLLWIVLALGVAAPAEGDAYPARKPPTKPQAKRKPPTHKKPNRKMVATAEQLEEDLHSERLAIMGRLKEINEAMRDAELAATIRRLDDLENKRHALAVKLITRAKEQDKEEAPK